MGDNPSRQKDNPISNDLTGIYNIDFMKIVLLIEEINRRYKESVSVYIIITYISTWEV